jgi:hypothetical protein
VVLPGAGSVRAAARASIRRGNCAAARACRRAGSTVATRVLTSTGARATGAGLLGLTLKLPHRYAPLARHRGGLRAGIRVAFAAAGHPPLSGRVAATFLLRPASVSNRASARGSAGRR